jgi:hypothetical protein
MSGPDCPWFMCDTAPRPAVEHMTPACRHRGLVIEPSSGRWTFITPRAQGEYNSGLGTHVVAAPGLGICVDVAEALADTK